MNEYLQSIFSDHFQLFLIGAAPMIIILLFLLFTLLFLHLRARNKSARMNNSDREMTSIGATTWDAYQGPSTQTPFIDSVDIHFKPAPRSSAKNRL